MLRMTKVLGVSALILATSAANAMIYIGGGLGSDFINFTQRARILKPNPGHVPEFDVINKAHLAATGVFGTLFVGVSKLYNNNFYLAAELNGNYSSANFTASNLESIRGTFSNTQLKIKNSVGISLLPGYQMTTSALLYGRLGLTNSEIAEKTTDISLANFGKRRNGFRYGLGLQQAITERISLRADYSRISYKSLVTSTLDAASGVIKTTKLTPNQQLIELGVLMNFDKPAYTK